MSGRSDSSTNSPNSGVIAEFRANDGRVGGRWETMSLLLLHTQGAKSKLLRIIPVVYVAAADKLLIAGSRAGADVHPSWVHNLRAHPRAHVEVGAEAFDVKVTELVTAEREHAYARMAQAVPVFADYQARTNRIIPVFALTKDRPVQLDRIEAGVSGNDISNTG